MVPEVPFTIALKPLHISPLEQGDLKGIRSPTPAHVYFGGLLDLVILTKSMKSKSMPMRKNKSMVSSIGLLEVQLQGWSHCW